MNDYCYELAISTKIQSSKELVTMSILRQYVYAYVKLLMLMITSRAV